MRFICPLTWLIWTAAPLLNGGVVGGVVLERQSGIPLARAKVRLDRVDLTGRIQSDALIAGRFGQFTFSSVPDGLYVLTAMRDGYAPIAFGQSRPQGTGPAFMVNKETNLFAELRLRKLGVLTGKVLDENRLGIRHAGVSAYSVKPPFRSVANAESDDRGVYRIHGLPEGKFRVRSQPFRHDDGQPLLPTFAPEMLILRDSLISSTKLDFETTDADVTPIPGNLISVAGSVSCAPNLPGYVTVTISTDTGRREARSVCQGSYQFENLAPGNYEVFGLHAEGRLAAFVEQRIFTTAKNLSLELRPLSNVELSLRDESGRTPVRTPSIVTLRRVDAAGVAETKTVPLEDRAAVSLSPGWWEVAAKMQTPYHLSGSGLSWRPAEPRPTADPDWFEFSIMSNSQNSVVLRTSNQAGGIAGKVADKQKGVAAIPVFLWPAAPDIRRRAGGPRMIAANVQGEFRFEGLPPGAYRIMASFDYEEVDEDILATANATAVTVAPSAVARVELSPYLAP